MIASVSIVSGAMDLQCKSILANRFLLLLTAAFTSPVGNQAIKLCSIQTIWRLVLLGVDLVELRYYWYACQSRSTFAVLNVFAL